MSGPHDGLVKWTFGQPERAAEELRAVLPSTLVATLDWPSLKLEPGSYVDEALKERFSDLLFSVRTRAGVMAQLFVLFEHQSSADAMMPFRVLRYMLRVWERWLEGRPAVQKLPAIIPVVLHHGASGWSAPVEFIQLVELDAPLKEAANPFIPNFRFVLDDLAVETDERLRARAADALTKLVLLALRHSRGDLNTQLLGLVDLMGQVLEAPHGPDALRRVLTYALEVTEGMTVETLRRSLVPLLGAKVEEIIMTGGQQLREEGRQLGRQEGRQEGQRAVLLRLLHAKFGPVSPEVRSRLESASPELLEEWVENFSTASRLADVFAPR